MSPRSKGWLLLLAVALGVPRPAGTAHAQDLRRPRSEPGDGAGSVRGRPLGPITGPLGPPGQAPASIDWILQASGYQVEIPASGPARVRAQYAVEVFTDGWQAIPTAGGDVVFTGAGASPENVPILLAPRSPAADGTVSDPGPVLHDLWVGSPGARTLSVTFETPVQLSPGSDDRRVSFDIPASPVNRVDLDFPGREVELLGDEGCDDASPRPATAGGERNRDRAAGALLSRGAARATTGSCSLLYPVSRRVQVRWREPAAPGLDGPAASSGQGATLPGASCRLETLFEVFPGWLLTTTLVSPAGPGTRSGIRLRLPEGARHLQVASPDERSSIPFEIGEETGSRILTVHRPHPSDRDPAFLVRFRRDRPSPDRVSPGREPGAGAGAAPGFELAVPEPMGHETLSGVSVVTQHTPLTVEIEEPDPGLLPVPDRLSPQLARLLRGDIVKIRSLSGPRPARVRVGGPRRMSAEDLAITRIEGRTMLTPEGVVYSHARLELRGARVDRALLHLPGNARILQCLIDGETRVTRPIPGQDPGETGGESDQTHLIPLPVTPGGAIGHHEMEVAWVESGPAPVSYGSRSWGLPRMTLPPDGDLPHDRPGRPAPRPAPASPRSGPQPGGAVPGARDPAPPPSPVPSVENGAADRRSPGPAALREVPVEALTWTVRVPPGTRIVSSSLDMELDETPDAPALTGPPGSRGPGRGPHAAWAGSDRLAARFAVESPPSTPPPFLRVPVPMDGANSYQVVQFSGSPRDHRMDGSIGIRFMSEGFATGALGLLFLLVLAALGTLIWVPGQPTLHAVTGALAAAAIVLGYLHLEEMDTTLFVALFAFAVTHGMCWAVGPAEEGD